MTYKTVSFATCQTPDANVFRVAWRGDDQSRTKIIDVRISTNRYEASAADAAELYVMWLVLSYWEHAGQSRTAKNLNVKVSRGAVKKILRADSTKKELNDLAYFGRTQFSGLPVEVLKKTPWVDWASESDCCVTLDDEPLPRPAVDVPGIGRVSITVHALEEYAADTRGEILAEHVYGRIAERLRGSLQDITLDERTQSHKRRKYGDEVDKTRILVDEHGWQYVLVEERKSEFVLKTVYNRGRGY